jgi:hypothetical protein
VVVAIWRARTATPSRGRHRAGYAPAAPPITIPPAATVGDGAATETQEPAEAYPATSDD